MYSLYFFAATFLGAAGMAFLGDRNRKFAAQQDFLSRLATTMHVELGLAESLRLLLEEFAAGISHRTRLCSPIATRTWSASSSGA